MRRAVRSKEPALVESGAVYVYNYHMPVRDTPVGCLLSLTTAWAEKCVASPFPSRSTSGVSCLPAWPMWKSDLAMNGS